MNKITFPIAEINENEIVTIDGERRKFFQITSVDLEQLDFREKESYFRGITDALDTISSESYFKFYKIGDRSYLESNYDEDFFPGSSLTPKAIH